MDNHKVRMARMNGLVNIDHHYDPQSENPISGIGAAEALGSIDTGGEKPWELLEDVSLTEETVAIYFDVEKLSRKKEVHIEGYVLPTDTTITSQAIQINNSSPVWQVNVSCKATGKIYIVMDVYQSPRKSTIYDGTISAYDYTLAGGTAKVTKMDADLSQVNTDTLFLGPQLSLRTTAANPMAVGTRVKVWGR